MNKFTTIMLMGLMVGLSCPSNMQNVNLKVEPKDTSIIVGFSAGIKDKTTDSIIANQNNTLNLISNFVTSNFTVVDRYTNITNAVSLKINSAYVDSIKNIPGVRNVCINKMHSKQFSNKENSTISIKKATNDTRSNVSAETMHKPSGTKEGEGVAVAVLDSGFLLDHDVNGVKYTHESFVDLVGKQLKFTEEQMNTITSNPKFHGKINNVPGRRLNNKVPFYFDYGGVAKEGISGPGNPKFDVYSEVDAGSHGQHVASIIGANGPYKGIAPNAQLICMKVFTDDPEDNSSGAYDSAILNALEDCAIMGVDVVNLSLGNNLDDFDDDSEAMKTIKRLQKEGMSINIAAGNDGKGYYKYAGSYANWSTDVVETGTLGSYANNSASMSVAAAIPTKEYFETAFVVNNGKTSGTVDFSDQHDGYPLSDLAGSSYGYVKIPGLGEEKDYTGLDVTGKIAVVDRGETTFVSKTTIAFNHGAIAVAIINNVAGEINFDLTDLESRVNIPVVGIRKEFRSAFVGNDGTVTSGTSNILVDQEYDSPSAYTPCTFTSDGAKYDFSIKPEISAPGQSVYGAVMTDELGDISTDSYEYYNGTSMATPNYCGAVALLLSEATGEEKDANVINQKMMSTADPMKVWNSDSSKQVDASVRIQGAGMVNIEEALNTKVYLEGYDVDGQTGLGKAKIQLFNNDKISKGKVELDFLAHNESNESIQYDVNTYVYRPELVSDETLTQGKLAAITDELLTVKSSTITLQAGDNNVHIDSIELTDAQKKEINDNFPYGCALEGYVVMTPKANTTDAVELNIPFLGFYGNYESAACVEPFAFEQNANHVYQSDVLNNLCGALGLSKADYKSRWVVGYAESMEDVDLESVAFNETNIASLNGYREITNPEEIYVGNNGVSNTMIIQQLVLRSVKDNTITLTNKNTGEVVLTDHMFSLFYGDERGAGLEHALMKSHAVSDYLVSGLVADRAYSIIPLYDTETKELFPDGEYEMKFSYELVAGGTQTMSYTVHIDSKAPTLKKVEDITSEGKDIWRIRIDEEALEKATVNGARVDVKKDSNGYYIDLLKNEYQSANKICLKLTDLAGASVAAMMNIENNNIVAIAQSADFVPSSNLNVAINSTGANQITVTASATTKQGKKIDISNYPVTIQITDSSIILSSLKVTDKTGSALDWSLSGKYLTVKNATEFVVNFERSYVPGTVQITNKIESLTVGQNHKLTATTTGGGEGEKVKYSSSAYDVASIDENGNIKALKEGTTVITALFGGQTDSFTLTVKAASNLNTALIIALSVSIPVVVIGGAVIIYFVRKKKIAK